MDRRHRNGGGPLLNEMSTEILTPDCAEIERSLNLLFKHGQIVELRGLHVEKNGYKNNIVSGYFDDMEACATAAYELSPFAQGIYVILNTFSPALLARGKNKLRTLGKGDQSTADGDITARRWLLVDADPVRPAGISSTEEEKELALDTVQAVKEVLTSMGWPLPVVADSGNGGHLLYTIDLPADDGGLVERVLKALANFWDTAQVKIDTTVHNPARISKLYGTLARKGDDIAERPHRLTRVLTIPTKFEPVPRELLEELASTIPQAGQATTQAVTPFDLERWISDRRLDVDGPEPWGDKGRRWVFDTCPWNPDHTDGSAYIVQFSNGAIGAGCHHNHCAGKGWHELRDLVEPGWREARDPYAGLDFSGIPSVESPVIEASELFKQPVKLAVKTRWTVAELYDTEFPEPKWAIPSLIPEGLTLIGGRPKVGKSWLALQMAHSMGTGGMFFDRKVEQGGVLYIALEDGPRRLKDRIKRHGIPRQALITFERTWPPLHKDGLDPLYEEIVRNEYRLVVIDTLTRAFRGLDQNDQPQIGAVMTAIQQMCQDHHLAIVFPDHTTKPKSFVGDPVDDIMNSTVKTAVADLVLALYKDAGKASATLKGRGRDVEEIDLSIHWDPATCCWQCDGEAGKVRVTAARQEIIEALEALGKSQAPAIARYLAKDRGYIAKELRDMYASQLIKREIVGHDVFYESLCQ
jgi:hypothetical protein